MSINCLLHQQPKLQSKNRHRRSLQLTLVTWSLLIQSLPLLPLPTNQDFRAQLKFQLNQHSLLLSTHNLSIWNLPMHTSSWIRHSTLNINKHTINIRNRRHNPIHKWTKWCTTNKCSSWWCSSNMVNRTLSVYNRILPISQTIIVPVQILTYLEAPQTTNNLLLKTGTNMDILPILRDTLTSPPCD